MRADILDTTSVTTYYDIPHTGWYHLAVHADPAAVEQADPPAAPAAANLDFDGETVTLRQLGIDVPDFAAVAAPGVMRTVNLKAGKLEVTKAASGGSSSKIRVEADFLQNQ